MLEKVNTIDQVLHNKGHSFTKNVICNGIVGLDFLTSSDRVLFIDDVLANGNVALVAFNLVKQSGTSLVGEFFLDKSLQEG